jgi:hypothetical protein
MARSSATRQAFPPRMAEKIAPLQVFSGINHRPPTLSEAWPRCILHVAERVPGPHTWVDRTLIRRSTMKVTRILSAVFVMLALGLGSLATSGCTSATDNGASGTSGGSGSSSGY